MTETKVYIVRRCDHRAKVIRSAWWTECEAEADSARLAREHASVSAPRVPSKQTRVVRETCGSMVQKFVDRYNGEWHTLSHYEVVSVAVRGSAVHRLAELVR